MEFTELVDRAYYVLAALSLACVFVTWWAWRNRRG